MHVAGALACLVGNGLSIAYNNELSVGALTRALIDRFQRLGGTDAANALATFARYIAGANDGGFERLLGPLDTASQALTQLRGLAMNAGPGCGCAR